MPDREKVIKGLECCIELVNVGCKECLYEKSCFHGGRNGRLLKDALALLNEQQERHNEETEVKKMTYEEGYRAGFQCARVTMPDVVRCKDCKYNDDGECIIKAGWFPVKPDWFCADGERK